MPLLRSTALGLLLAALNVACGHGQTRDAAPGEQGQPVEIRNVDVSPSGGLRMQATVLVRDDQKWAEVWQAIWDDGEKDGASLPHVDFRTHSVVVAALGGRPSGGYRVTIEVEAAAASTLLVLFTEHRPGPRCVTTAIVTYPTSVAVVPIAARAAKFRSRSVVENCE